MLILSRKTGEAVAIAANNGLANTVRVTVLSVRGSQVKLGFEAEDDVAIHRWEVWERVCVENLAASLLPGGVELPTDRWQEDDL